MKNLILWIVIAVSLYTALYLIHKRALEKSVFRQLYQHYKGEKERRIAQEAGFIAKYGEIENNSLLYRADRMILQSGLKKYLPKLSGELYLCILALTFPGTAYVAYGITGNVFLSLFLGVAAVTAEILFVVILSGKTYDRIEEDTPLFVSILNNHAKSSTDIVTIMTRTVSGMDGPIKEIVSGFLVTAEKYGNADLAFDFACESVDNRTLKTIFVNLKKLYALSGKL